MNPRPYEIARRNLAEMFLHGVQAVHGGDRVAEALRAHPLTGVVAAIAIGKAAAAMLHGAQHVLGRQLVAALLITKQGHFGYTACSDDNVICVQGGHPVPDEHSLAAGNQLLSFISDQPQHRMLLFLISGGSSSLVEVLRDGLPLNDLQRANRWLLGSGLDIVAINRVRQMLSGIKGGRLLQYLGGRPARVLLLSDVPGNDPAIIGSGLLWPSAPVKLPEQGLPDWLLALCHPDAGQDNAPVGHAIVATLDIALDAVAQQAARLGYPVQLVQADVTGNAEDHAMRIIDFLRNASPGIYLWGGETTVRLPKNPGQGGRNQQLALCAALQMADRPDFLLLAAGTDGNDGNTHSAGAIVDAGTLARATACGVDAMQSLENADAGSCLAASGDLLVTGPTGTNVMDIMIGMKLPLEIKHEQAD
jgi:hydroxypyruvate reductase